MWEYRATLASPGRLLAKSIHDGDTVELMIDLGFDVRVEKWIRLAGVRAPELAQLGGPEARSFVADWLTGRVVAMSGLDWPFLVMTEKTKTAEPTERTSFSRYVGYVQDIRTGDSLNADVEAFLSAHPDWPKGE